MGNNLRKEDDWAAIPRGIWREKKLFQQATFDKKSPHIKTILHLLQKSVINGHVYIIQWTRVFMRLLEKENYTYCNTDLIEILNYIFVFLEEKEIPINKILKYAIYSKYLLNIGIITKYTMKSRFRVQDELAMFIFYELDAMNMNFAEYLKDWDNLIKDIIRLGVTLPRPAREVLEANDVVTGRPRSDYISLEDLLAAIVVYRRVREKKYQETQGFSCSTPKFMEREAILMEHIGLMLRSMSPTSLSSMQSRCQEHALTGSTLFKECSFSDAVESLDDNFTLLDSILGYEVCGLKHLCRLVIRRRLFLKWALPEGIYVLPIPTHVQDFLNLKED